ncbi:hypothetical protein CONLIGDRAFT_686785 [Coniochaeta ligniaria NRRL 30616]|uniref:C2H2-type domain-containing protein n=1 Tax=Coniochaeta ligniaria NRRL 30616 TaxID=1408157 RepID=A0A1J7I7E5_9PEZI|nr:hypothetical protein CONLIGDRAFT_686785 [Coniochaeta ligniaria NRRL 30616]
MDSPQSSEDCSSTGFPSTRCSSREPKSVMIYDDEPARSQTPESTAPSQQAPRKITNCIYCGKEFELKGKLLTHVYADISKRGSSTSNPGKETDLSLGPSTQNSSMSSPPGSPALSTSQAALLPSSSSSTARARVLKSISATKPHTHIKRTEVSQFGPTYPQDLGMVSNDRTLVFTDVMAFQRRLYTFTDSADTENQILNMFHAFLSG